MGESINVTFKKVANVNKAIKMRKYYLPYKRKVVKVLEASDTRDGMSINLYRGT